MSDEGQQVSIFSQGNQDEAKRERVKATLDALVDEAYAKELKNGTAITSPEAWRQWKRQAYIEMARREGPGYLAQHYERIFGRARAGELRTCDFCGANIAVAWFELGGKKYCDVDCAEGRDKRMTLEEWKKKVQAEGGYVSPESGEFVPVEQIALFQIKKPPGDE